MEIIIPKIQSLKLYGFRPVFNNPVSFQIFKNLYLILGGNGLGKTTILQSIVYGLAGPADANIEQLPQARWGKSYFRDRLESPDDASVEIMFSMGEDEVVLRRGFKSEKILGFILNAVEVTEDGKDAEALFEEYLIENSGYSRLADFNFIVHKLCYLSEKRENLIWNVDAQTRVIMQLISDPAAEVKFRQNRATLKEIDSRIRHLNVDVNKIDDQIQGARSDKKSKPRSVAITDNAWKSTIVPDYGASVKELEKDLVEVNEAVSAQQKKLRNLKKSLSSVVDDISAIQEKLERYEHAFFQDQLNKIESAEAKLAIHKLIHRKICPSCGTKSEALYKRAIEFVQVNCCPLCGTDNTIGVETLTPGIEAELSEKLAEKVSIENNIIEVETSLDGLNDTLNTLNVKVSSFALSRPPSVVFIDKSPKKNKINISDLRKAFRNLNSEMDKQKILFNKLKRKLDNEYEEFNTQNNTRLERLAELYKKYASDFLGIECSLVPLDDSDKFINLKLFVPKFNDKVRVNPDSCSEAQRFFLDIAFRMALIQLSHDISKSSGSFLCETPENALDITYVNNVADMLEAFSLKNKNTLLLTCNIQPGGIAHALLTKISNKNTRQKHFLNMLEIANLSEVQSGEYGRGLLDSEIKKILTED